MLHDSSFIIRNSALLGIDEAGRGPVIGPMVVAGLIVKDKSLIPYLKKIKVKSSKLLPSKKREKFYNLLLKLKKGGAADFSVRVIPPKKIDKYSLNYLFARSILFFTKKYEPKKLYVDACVNPKGLKKYKNNLRLEIMNLYRSGTSIVSPTSVISFICQNFADEKYPIVSAASIIAKVARDREIKKLHKKYSCDFGSGYCHDQKTIKFLKDYYKQKNRFPYETRLKWESFLNKIKNSKEV